MFFVSVLWQAAGVIHRDLCPLAQGRTPPGATLEVGSATAKWASGARAAVTVFPATGALVRRAVNPAPAPTAVMQPPGSV